MLLAFVVNQLQPPERRASAVTQRNEPSPHSLQTVEVVALDPFANRSRPRADLEAKLRDEGVNEALDDVASGKVVKALVVPQP